MFQPWAIADFSGWIDWAWANLLTEQVGQSIFILALSALLQSTAGFGAALFGLPLLLWAGNSLVESQLLILAAMLPQNIFAYWRLRHHVNLRELALPAAIRIVTLPLGVAALSQLMTYSTQTIGQVVGIVILVAIGMQSLAGMDWKNAKHWSWLLVTFGGSGFLQGLMGTGGPPMVLWVHGQRYGIDRARAFLFAVYVIGFVPQALLLRWTFGELFWRPIAVAIVALPFVLAASELGLQLGRFLGDGRMRRLTYLVLFALGLIAIMRPWLAA